MNPRFGLVLAVLYALLAWPLVDESASPGKNSAPDFLEVLGQMLAQLPGVLGISLIMLMTMGFRAVDPHRKWIGVGAALIHGLLHVGLAIIAFMQIQQLLAGKPLELKRAAVAVISLAASWAISYLLSLVSKARSGLFGWMRDRADHWLAQLLILVLPMYPVWKLASETMLSELLTVGFVEASSNHWLALAAVSGLLVTGFLAGGVLMGVYLLVSLNVLGRHANEAFSALRVEDYKNFLRLHIRPDGKLEVYPVGIDKVPETGSTVCHLIDPGCIRVGPDWQAEED